MSINCIQTVIMLFIIYPVLLPVFDHVSVLQIENFKMEAN